MDLKNFDVNKWFFKIGAICFGIVASTQTIIFVTNFNNYILVAKIMTMAQTFFSYTLCAFFVYMYLSQPSQPKIGQFFDDELKKALEEVGIKK